MPGTLRIGNLRKGSPLKPRPDETAIAVDRSHPTLGNRHVLKDTNDDQERSRVISCYRVDYKADIKRQGPMYKATAMIAARVRRGENIILMCWCAPKDCHAGCIVEGIELMLNPPESDIPALD